MCYFPSSLGGEGENGAHFRALPQGEKEKMGLSSSCGKNMSEPWYRDGLRFQCTRCGNCCTGPPGVVWVTDEEIEAIALHRGEPFDQLQVLYTRTIARKRSLREKQNGDCIFYDRAQGCTIYPVRPRQCRTWPFWESNLKTEQDWQRTCEVCPGAGQGELIPEEEITRRLRVIRI